MSRLNARCLPILKKKQHVKPNAIYMRLTVIFTIVQYDEGNMHG